MQELEEHTDYCVLDEFQLPDNVNNIYADTHKCNNCKRNDRIVKIENLYMLDPECEFRDKVLDLRIL